MLGNNISIAATERQLVGMAHSDPSKYEYHWMYHISRVVWDEITYLLYDCIVEV